jgi:BlaI family transcriptional regulator, penicillinase repressor
MKRSRSHTAVRPPLGGLEHAVMQVIWTAGPGTVESVHAAVARDRDLKEVTTRTVLRRLEQKGYLQHDVSGRAYIYRAVEPRRSLAARTVRQIIDRLCHGSVEELVSGLVDGDVLSDAELQALEDGIRARKRAPAKSQKKGR